MKIGALIRTPQPTKKYIKSERYCALIGVIINTLSFTSASYSCSEARQKITQNLFTGLNSLWDIVSRIACRTWNAAWTASLAWIGTAPIHNTAGIFEKEIAAFHIRVIRTSHVNKGVNPLLVLSRRVLCRTPLQRPKKISLRSISVPMGHRRGPVDWSKS
jgi:hypothetical protein